MRGNETKIVAFSSLGHFFFHFHELAFPALAIPLSSYLKLELQETLKLGFPMYLSFGIFALPWGYVADKFGNKKALTIGFLGIGLASLLLFISNSPIAILICLSAVGFFSGIFHPAGMGLISIGATNIGSALGSYSIAGTLGLIIAPFFAGFVNWLAGWQLVYLLAGILAISCGVVLSFTTIDERRTPREKKTNETYTLNTEVAVLILFFSIVALGGFTYRINIVVLPAYLELQTSFLSNFLKTLGLSNPHALPTTAAGILTSIIYIVGISGQFMGGYLADKKDLRYMYLLYYAGSIPFIFAMAFISELPLVISAALYVFFAIGVQPIENSLVAYFTPLKWRSTAYGFSSVLTFGVGSLAIYLVGWVKVNWNLEIVYLYSGALTIIILLFISLLILITKGKSIVNT
ncbi:MAG: MFS transporter [Syntrophales bacterium]|nr:MFS transporter [Syntrophales bacterium]